MTQVIPVPVRREIIQRHTIGQPLKKIAQDLHLSFWGVRRIWRQYRQQGEAGLAIHYDRCGRKGHHSDQLLYRCAVWLKRHHPPWGAGLIRIVLQKRYPQRQMPSARTIQRWVAQARISPPSARATSRTSTTS